MNRFLPNCLAIKIFILFAKPSEKTKIKLSASQGTHYLSHITFTFSFHYIAKKYHQCVHYMARRAAAPFIASSHN
jgi:hypothetical protein